MDKLVPNTETPDQCAKAQPQIEEQLIGDRSKARGPYICEEIFLYGFPNRAMRLNDKIKELGGKRVEAYPKTMEEARGNLASALGELEQSWER
jgi:hypothetical protein